MKNIFKGWWNKLLIFIRIRNPVVYIAEKSVLKDVKTYQQASLAMLQNLHCHISTSNIKFKVADKIKADLSNGAVRFKEE